MKIIIYSAIVFAILSCKSEDKKLNREMDNSDNVSEMEELTNEPNAAGISYGVDELTSSTEVVKEKGTKKDQPKDIKNIDKEQIKTDNGIVENKETPKETEKIAATDIHAHEKLNTLLKKYVSSAGKVDYEALKANKSEVDAVIKDMKENTVESSWTSKQKLAYWINAYNIFTIKLVIDNYPVKSIKDINNDKPWDKKFIEIGGKTYSLNDIENNIIRKDFNEPRIHFAVNCASISCPKLINEAFTASKMESQLTKATKDFLKDTGKNKLEESKIQISNIFNWYKADFEKAGGVISFINKYSDTEVKSDATVSYMDYNWNLNKK